MANGKEAKSGLALMREPFPASAISKLPKPTKAQTDEVKANFKAGIRCQVCGGWHHPKVVHLDYVGHAALTDRLLQCDPEWNWEPVATDEMGLPVRDRDGGMWIRLTVCGVTRLGYGDADGKTGPSATKELIGDALRNAAMRFGAALDLWHKGDLHPAEDEPPPPQSEQPPDQPAQRQPLPEYSANRFAEKLPEWRALIESGEKSAGHIVAMLSKRASLTEQQIKAIKGE